MIFVIIALVIVGLVVVIIVKGKADAQKAKNDQIAALIYYKQSKEANETKKKTSWLDGITGVASIVSNILAPGSGAGAEAAGSGIKNFIK